jgi:DNA (cytosine-5)-methyltransferase 1
MKVNKKLNIVELYAGTARSAEAFRRWKKSNVALLIDNNDFAAKTYQANYPDTPYIVDDLTQISPKDIETTIGGKVDVLLGCPPCQGFSAAGGRDPEDPRNNHLILYANFIASLKPMAVSMENVPLAADSELFKQFVKIIEKAGYYWTAGILNAALRGSTQSRQRLLLIAIRKDIGIAPKIPKPSHGGKRKYYNYSYQKLTSIQDDPVGVLGETPATSRLKKSMPYFDEIIGNKDIPTIGELFSDLPPVGSKAAEAIGHNKWSHTPEMAGRMSNVPEGGRWDSGRDYFSNAYGKLHRKGLARTLTTFFSNPGSGRYWHPTENRTLSVREAARIQGFPDSFKFLPPYSKSARLIGNALDASIAEVAYKVIRESLE